MIKKIVAVTLVIILLLNFIGIMLGKVSIAIFWLVLILIFIIAYFFFPKNEKIKAKKKK